MALSLRLLAHAEVEEFIRSRRSPGAPANTLLLCTVMEFVELAERIKKSHSSLDLQLLLQHASEDDDDLHTLDLDGERLLQALFEYTDTHNVDGIWSGIEIGSTPSDGFEDRIGRVVRRLILRPTPESWWDADLYNQMEAWYAE